MMFSFKHTLMKRKNCFVVQTELTTYLGKHLFQTIW